MSEQEAVERLRDLTRRLGFGDGVTEPMADNDSIVEWVEQQRRDADEWRESQAWRAECYFAGHPDDEDCYEHDPALRLAVAEERLKAIVAPTPDPSTDQPESEAAK